MRSRGRGPGAGGWVWCASRLHVAVGKRGGLLIAERNENIMIVQMRSWNDTLRCMKRLSSARFASDVFRPCNVH